MELEEKVLVGWFARKMIFSKFLKDGRKLNFDHWVGYTPYIMTLAKGSLL